MNVFLFMQFILVHCVSFYMLYTYLCVPEFYFANRDRFFCFVFVFFLL
jgi:hypothetical protein